MTNDSLFSCDWCGFEMIAVQCKVVCPNCGGRWDCSDVTIWLGDGPQPGEVIFPNEATPVPAG